MKLLMFHLTSDETDKQICQKTINWFRKTYANKIFQYVLNTD